MIKYLQEQFFIHASASAKKVMHHKGHQLKKNMPRNVSTKNALRIARLRNKKPHINRVKKLKETAEHHQKKSTKLEEEVHKLTSQIDHYQVEYGISKSEKVHKTYREQLQEIIKLQREIIEKQLEAKEAFHKKILNKKEYTTIHDQFEEKQDILRNKKKEILTS